LKRGKKRREAAGALSTAPGRRVQRRGIRNGICRLVESGLGGRAKTDKAKEYEEIHDTPLQQFLLLKKIFI
jgi:hypothetical protein